MQTKVSCGLHWSGHGHACPLLCVGHALAYTQQNASTTTEAKCAWPLQFLSSSFKQGKCWEFVVLCVNALLSVRWFVLTCQVGTIDLEVFVVKIYWFA